MITQRNTLDLKINHLNLALIPVLALRFSLQTSFPLAFSELMFLLAFVCFPPAVLVVLSTCLRKNLSNVFISFRFPFSKIFCLHYSVNIPTFFCFFVFVFLISIVISLNSHPNVVSSGSDV